MKKQMIVLFIAVVLAIVMAPQLTVQAKDKGYLVLVQIEKDGKWTAYENMASRYSMGGAMVDGSEICDALGLTYDDTKSGFTISRANEKIIFNGKDYTYKYYDGSKTVKKRPPVPSEYDCCYYEDLSDLSINVQYYNRIEAQDNGVYGYRGVICYSMADKITKFPELNNILNNEGNSIFTEQTQPEKKAPLVLIQNKKNGVWTYYDNLATISEKGDIMVKAIATAKTLGLKYSYLIGNLYIEDYPKDLTIHVGDKEYSQNGDHKYKDLKAKAAPYTDWKSGADMIYYDILDFLVHTQYYTGEAVTEYQKMGYDSIICYSSAGKISGVPDINKIVKAKEFPKNKETIKIGGIEIPKLSSFAASALKDENWGYDRWEYGYYPLETMLSEYSLQMRKDIMAVNDADNPGEYAQLTVLDYMMQAEIEGDSSTSCLRLYKQDNCYEIYISCRLSKNPKPTRTHPDYSKIVQNVLKLYCTCISSTPDTLYDRIYRGCEVDSSALSKKWTTIGDSKVKYRVQDRHAIIISVKAK